MKFYPRVRSLVCRTEVSLPDLRDGTPSELGDHFVERVLHLKAAPY